MPIVVYLVQRLFVILSSGAHCKESVYKDNIIRFKNEIQAPYKRSIEFKFEAARWIKKEIYEKKRVKRYLR